MIYTIYLKTLVRFLSADRLIYSLACRVWFRYGSDISFRLFSLASSFCNIISCSYCFLIFSACDDITFSASSMPFLASFLSSSIISKLAVNFDTCILFCSFSSSYSYFRFHSSRLVSPTLLYSAIFVSWSYF